MKHLFIINPAAGKGKTLELIPKIEKIMKERNEEFHIEITEKVGHATDIARAYVSNGNYRVYSIGGDGTLNEVLNGVMGSDSSIAVIPSGSGNDFVRSIYGSINKEKILEEVIHSKEEKVDVAKVNGRYCLNIASVGFDGEVVYNAARLKKLPLVSGSLAYILGIIITVFKYKYYVLNISIDHINFNSETLLLAVANGKYYGGGIKMAPEAEIRDGMFDICLVKKASRLKILTLFPKAIKGTHGNIKEVSFYRGKKVTVTSEQDIMLNIDGEISKVRNADLEIIPSGISIVIP